MTKEEALTMIIASIAMEELAFSHIVNAEGEKLQYVLGTLPGGQKTCAGTQEILAVNKSVKELLDTVMQNQMLLKGKLERALEAGGHAPPCPQPCPPPSPKPCPPPCGGGPGARKSAIQLSSRCSGFSWDNSHALTWKRRGQRGGGIRWDEKTPAVVRLDTEKIYVLDYTVNIRGPYFEGGAGAVYVKLTPGGAFSGVLPLYFSVKSLECRPQTLHYSTMLFPQACPESTASLSLLLNYQDSLFVDEASLSIAEI